MRRRVTWSTNISAALCRVLVVVGVRGGRRDPRAAAAAAAAAAAQAQARMMVTVETFVTTIDLVNKINNY